MTSKTDTDGTRPRPHLTLELREDGAGVLNGRVVVPAAAGNVRALLLRIIGEVATATGTPLQIQARDPQGTWSLTAWPNGAVTDQNTDVPAAGRWYVAAHDPATAPAAAAPAPAAPAAPAADLLTPPSPPVLTPVPGPGREPISPGGYLPVPAWTGPARPGQASALGGRPERAGRSRGAALLWAGALGVTGVLVTAAVITLAVHGTGEQDTKLATESTQQPGTAGPPSGTGGSSSWSAASPATTVMAPMQLPNLAVAPPGFGAKPIWGRAVPTWTKIDVGADGTVVTRTTADTLVRLNATTGAVTWTAAGRWDRQWQGPWNTTIDGRPAVALTSTTSLVYWHPTGSPDPVTLDLPAGAAARWAGPSPLIVTAAGGAAVVQSGALTTVPLPAGTRPLAADGSTVIGVTGGSWVRASPQGPPTVKPLPRPKGATGTPVRVESVSSTYLLAAWPKRGRQHVALIDATTGQALLQTALNPNIDITNGPVIHQLGGPLTAVGAVVVDPVLHSLHVLLNKYQVQSLVPGHVIARDGTHLHDIALSTSTTFTITAYPKTATVAPFAAPKNSSGLVVTPNATDSLLLGLPATRK